MHPDRRQHADPARNDEGSRKAARPAPLPARPPLDHRQPRPGPPGQAAHQRRMLPGATPVKSAQPRRRRRSQTRARKGKRASSVLREQCRGGKRDRYADRARSDRQSLATPSHDQDKERNPLACRRLRFSIFTLAACQRARRKTAPPALKHGRPKRTTCRSSPGSK